MACYPVSNGATACIGQVLRFCWSESAYMSAVPEVSSQVARLCRAHAGVRGLNKFDPRRIKIIYRA
jgi:hypothetical protein